MFYFWILAFICLCSCEKPHPITEKNDYPAPFSKEISFNWLRINSRDEGDPSSRFPLYIAKVPSDWVKLDPEPTESNEDTKKPLVEFFIEENNRKVRITVHNFPSNEIQDRIPQAAQIERWKSQFDSLNPIDTIIQTEAHNGFVGLFLQCQGILEKKPTKLLGWAMQLAPEYYTVLSFDDSFYLKQKRSDYTIKAIGDPELVNKNADGIQLFASSFQLIDDLPEPQPL